MLHPKQNRNNRNFNVIFGNDYSRCVPKSFFGRWPIERLSLNLFDFFKKVSKRWRAWRFFGRRCGGLVIGFRVGQSPYFDVSRRFDGALSAPRLHRPTSAGDRSYPQRPTGLAGRWAGHGTNSRFVRTTLRSGDAGQQRPAILGIRHRWYDTRRAGR